MLTPQEVSARAFNKSSFGGYNMAMVDEFLDQITADYTALYKENTLLKTKLKTLTDTIDEYRSTESAMRKALLAAQQMADEMVQEAEERKTKLIQDAETEALARVTELTRQVEEEENKLASAQDATATYISRLRALFSRHEGFINSLCELTPQAQTDLSKFDDAGEPAAEESAPASDTATFKRYSILLPNPDAQSEEEKNKAASEASKEPSSMDLDTTRRLDRFGDLQFGKDFEIG